MTHLVVDGNSIAHWRFWASPRFMDTDGREVGMLRSVEKWLREAAPGFEATEITVCFDGKRNWRYDLLAKYKGKRGERDPALDEQLAALPGFLSASFGSRHGWGMWQVDGFEADDLCAAIVAELAPGEQAIVASIDKDLCQLVDDARGVRIFSPRKRQMLTEEVVLNDFGVPAYRLREYLALCGDAVDNVKSLPGWGPAKAVAAINETIDFEHLLEQSKRLALKSVPERLQKTLNERVDALRVDYEVVGFRFPETP